MGKASHSVGIALGSNLGRKLDHLRHARDLLFRLALPGTSPAQAPVYETEPVSCPDGSPDFHNTVVEIEFAGTPSGLLRLTQEIEEKLGRDRSAGRNAPRIIDVDILYFEGVTVDDGTLVLPHPRLTARRFVLQPLSDIRPDLVLPGHTLTIAEHLLRLDSSEPPLRLVTGTW